MREILFRGKAINRNENYSYRTDYKNGDWVYGLLADVNDYAGFSKMTNTDGVTGIEVDTNTVGQYTGSKDMNDTKIFEGDIVYSARDAEPAVITWDDFTVRFIIEFDGIITDYDNYYASDLEVIGNIHDNPELLEVQG